MQPINRGRDCIYWASSHTSFMKEELRIRRSKHTKNAYKRNWVDPISGSNEPYSKWRVTNRKVLPLHLAIRRQIEQQRNSDWIIRSTQYV